MSVERVTVLLSIKTSTCAVCSGHLGNVSIFKIQGIIEAYIIVYHLVSKLITKGFTRLFLINCLVLIYVFEEGGGGDFGYQAFIRKWVFISSFTVTAPSKGRSFKRSLT